MFLYWFVQSKIFKCCLTFPWNSDDVYIIYIILHLICMLFLWPLSCNHTPKLKRIIHQCGEVVDIVESSLETKVKRTVSMFKIRDACCYQVG